jgi:uncharacterized membrane protein
VINLASKSTTDINLDPKTAATLCYVPAIGGVAALVLLLIHKDQSVRWNAAQSLALLVGLIVVDFILRITIFLAPLQTLVNIAGLVVVPLVLAVKVYQGQPMRLPFLADLADKFVGKV